MKIEIIDPIECRVSKKDAKLLIPCLSYKAVYWRKGQFSKKRTEYIKQCFSNKTKDYWYFYTGHLDRVVRFCKKEGFLVELNKLDLSIPCYVPHIPNITLREDQETAVRASLNKQRGIIKEPTGCISGDSIIRLNRAKKGGTATIKHMYLKLQGGEKTAGPKWGKKIPTKIRAYKKDKNKIQLHEIKDIVYSGKKQLYLLTLLDGKKIKTTNNHLFLTHNGWKQLKNLSIKKDKIMIDSPHTKKAKKISKQKKVWYKEVWNLHNHPFARSKHKRVEKHRIIYEANLNNKTLKQYIKILRTNPSESKKLKFINPKIWAVHHKNKNIMDNNIKNLEKLTHKKHLKLHANYGNFNQGSPTYKKIKSIKTIGIEDTYDIICKDPYRNFSANDIIIHNSGKTILQLSIISAFEGKSILLLAHTSSIVNQTVEKIRKLGWDCVQIGGGQSLIGEFFRGEIVVATIQSFAKINPDKYNTFFDIMIVDEAHRVSSFDGLYAKVLSNLLAPVRLGFTATLPYKEEAKMALEGLIGPLIIEQTINEASEKKILAVPKIKIIKSKFNQKVKEERKYSEVYQKGIVENLSRNKQIVDIIIEHKEKGQTTLIFVNKIKHGKNLAELFLKKGVRVPFIQGSMPDEKREVIKKSLIKKKRKIVITTTAWKEGVDIPSLDIVFNAGGGKSEIAVLQSIGRGLRRTDEKEEVIIYDFFDSSHNFLISHFGERFSLYCENNWV